MPADRDARIRERAYHIWVEDGRGHGKEHEHWRRAERDIAAEDAKAEADGVVAGGGAEPVARGPAGRAAARNPTSGEAAPPARKPRGKPTPKRDAPSAESDARPARRRQREPSGAGC